MRLAAPRNGSENEVSLTKRESEVLKQLAFGLTNKEIAQSLGISYETVKEHVQHILRKIGVSDRTQAAVWAVRTKSRLARRRTDIPVCHLRALPRLTDKNVCRTKLRRAKKAGLE